MVKLRRADQHPQRPNRQPNVRMNVDRPDAAERDQPRKRLQRESQSERRQVDQADRVDGVNGVFAMGGEPVQVFGGVMDGVKAPQKLALVLQAMSPVDAE